MQVMLMRLMSKGEYLIVPKGTKFTGSGKLGLIIRDDLYMNLHWNCTLWMRGFACPPPRLVDFK